MPIYEYWCLACKKKSSFFLRSITSPLTPVCQSCGSEEMQRAISTFSYHQSHDLSNVNLDDPSSMSEDLFNDPKNVSRMMEQEWQRSMGSEPMPAEMREAMEMASDGDFSNGAEGDGWDGSGDLSEER